MQDRTAIACVIFLILQAFLSANTSVTFIPLDPATINCSTAECHGSMMKQSFLHAPASQGDCNECHIIISAAEAELLGAKVHPLRTVTASLELCSKCHRQFAEERAVVHEPILENCSRCHDPHGGSGRYFIKGKSAGDLCLECHMKVTENLKYLHGPVALKDCLACHVAHASEHEGLLARPKQTLCARCHVDLYRSRKGAASVHPPAEESCSSCHQPHGGNQRAYLTEDREQLCSTCHSQVAELMQHAAFPHHEMIEGKECFDCHDPHWSANSKLLDRSSMEICLGCHGDEVETSAGRSLQPVGRIISESKFVHGPIRDGDCTPCHAAHGSDDPRLMKHSFPQGFYAEYHSGEYDLCFGCHNPALIEKRRTSATGFRNGELNLHFTHVHDEKGRTCRACHHEHASNNPFHIRDNVAFGNWQLEIRFVPSETGGTCLAGCHKPKSYDRVTPYNYAQ